MAQVLCFGRNKRQLLFLSDAARSAGHYPVRCKSLRAALRRMRTGAIATVIVEYRPGDFTLVKLLAAAKSSREIPVIVVSSHLTAAFRLCQSLADLYLEEPASQRELAGFVDLLLGAEAPRHAVEQANEHLLPADMPIHAAFASRTMPIVGHLEGSSHLSAHTNFEVKP